MWALIPCAGAGSRAGSGRPKQYRMIAGQPLVLHTIAAMVAVSRVCHTLVVLSRDDLFLKAFAPADGQPWSCVSCGGVSRAESVGNGLQALQGGGAARADWVLVHDAARCLVTVETIDRLIDACLGDAVGGLLAHPVSDTLKLARDGRVLQSPDRALHWLAQTPQMFRIGPLQDALLRAGSSATDEASAMEAIGLAPLLVVGSADNFKVTYAQDLLLAQALLLQRAWHQPLESDYDYP
ncbi:MAG: 2-C-methyl-D-erythritol 4-phosphate cytidylyltransferase [Rhodoferax sp.]|nr:2-C-methyl-D-erythritol 4-phosphate cytidylyltransferase [Rhodoferax sp.]